MTARRVCEIDWSSWRAADPATLVFVVKGRRILLIRKKRGLGAGKINGPGGRREPGESFRDCAVREMREELGVTPLGLVALGQHCFQFVDGYSTFVRVYRASDLAGEPVETDEAAPRWFDVDAIPFDEMWEDDRLWLPLLVAGRRFTGRWIFDGDRMLDHALDVLPAAPAEPGGGDAAAQEPRQAAAAPDPYRAAAVSPKTDDTGDGNGKSRDRAGVANPDRSVIESRSHAERE